MTAGDGITVVIAREVAAVREKQFSRWVDEELLAAAARFPGFLGTGLLEPAPGARCGTWSTGSTPRSTSRPGKGPRCAPGC